MKKLWCLAVLMVIFGLSACGGGNYDGMDAVETEQEYLHLMEIDEEDYEEDKEIVVYEEPQFIPAPFSVEAAAYYLRRLEAAWDADDGELWACPFMYLL